jgi:polyhydroxyalkanoate synthesis regulator protein
MLSRYLEQSLGTVVRQQQTVQAEMAKVLEKPLAPFQEMARQNMELWARMQASMLSAFTPPSTAGTDSPTAAEMPDPGKSGSPPGR